MRSRLTFDLCQKLVRSCWSFLTQKVANTIAKWIHQLRHGCLFLSQSFEASIRAEASENSDRNADRASQRDVFAGQDSAACVGPNQTYFISSDTADFSSSHKANWSQDAIQVLCSEEWQPARHLQRLEFLQRAGSTTFCYSQSISVLCPFFYCWTQVPNLNLSSTTGHKRQRAITQLRSWTKRLSPAKISQWRGL